MNIDEMITMYKKMNSYFMDIMVEEAAGYPILGFLVMNFATLFAYIEGSPSHGHGWVLATQRCQNYFLTTYSS